MTYEFRFVRRLPGQSLEEALAAVSDLPRPLPRERTAQFARLVDEARSALAPGEVIEEVPDAAAGPLREGALGLRHEPSGVHLTVLADEIVLDGPEDEADLTDDVLAGLHQLAAAVERITGLTGWDLMLGEPVSDPTLGQERWGPAATDDDADDEEVWPAPAGGAPAAAGPTVEEALPPRRRPRSWWQFWR